MSDEARVLPAVTLNADIDKAVRDAIDPADIKAAIIAEAEKQLGVTTAAATQAAADKAAVDKAAADATAALEVEPFTRTETIGGKEFVFEAGTELELERVITNAYKVADAFKTPYEAPEPVEPVVDEAAQRKAAEEAAIAKVELEQKFRRGEIPVDEYLQQSGAVESYLASQGLPIDSLKTAVKRSQEQVEEQSWADAVTTFRNSPQGRDWPGGDKNLELIGMRLNPDATDKLADIARAWDAMKSTGSFFPYEPTAVVTPAAIVVAPAAIAPPVVVPPAVVVPRTPAASSSIFGASSGVGDNEGVSKVAPVGDVKIDPNASPAEIIEAYKKANFAAGVNPNDAFQQAFSARRV